MARRSFKPTASDGRDMVQLPASADDLPERVVVDLDAKDPNELEIDVVDDTPEEERGRPNAKRLTALEEEEADLRDVSSKVQKRINRLRFEVQSQVREKSAAERERDAAVQALRDREAEIARLRQIAETGSTALMSSMRAEREGRLQDAQRRLSQAHAEGNSDAMAQATADISAAQAELAQINARAPAPRAATEEAPRQPAAQPQRQVPPTIEPNVAAWISHNDRWFNRDPAKTDLAMSIHRTLLARGVKTTSAEYTQELDKGLKAVYPDHQPYDSNVNDDDFDEDAGSRPRRTNAVEQGSRAERVGAPPSNPRRVELTQSELSLAKRLGITPAAYALEKIKYAQKTKGGA